eukprot:gene25924-32432_t
MLTLNSFPATAPNLQQPDMWSRFLIPKYFPQHAPALDPTQPFPKNPVNGSPVLGCRLNMDDFMNLRQFCIDLFNHEIVPCIERRLAHLNRQVTDARKGVKNVLKSFWRKPREDADSKQGSVKYRYDKVETQILLLADLSFMIKDFETAASMYRLVRDDYKSDKSLMHLAHTSLMIAACSMLGDSSKSKDLHGHLEALGQVLASIPPVTDLPHAHAYFALLASEMYVYNVNTKAPLESAKILLQAASNLPRYPMLVGLLTERAAGYFLQAGQTRKYIFHSVLAGNRMLRCGPRPTRHAAVCFACSMLILDKGHWGDLKAKLSRALANDLKFSGREGAQRSLVMMLKMLSAVLDENNDVGNKASLMDAINVYNEIVDEGAWGSILIGEGWRSCLTRQVLLGSLPIGPMNILANDIYKNRSEVVGLAIPGVDKNVTSILNPLNGIESVVLGASNNMNSQSSSMAEEMRVMLDLERQWVDEQASPSSSDAVEQRTLSDKIAEAELDLFRLKASGRQTSGPAGVVRIPLGEDISVRLKLSNKLPVDLQLTRVCLVIEPQEQFHSSEVNLLLSPESTSELVLSAAPQKIGKYNVDSARWNLSDYFSVRQPLRRDGPLLQRTLDQRVNRDRGADKSMEFEVVAAHPLLKVSFEGLSAEVLQGQLLKSVLVLRNDGAATATDIFIKFSQPSFVLYSSESGTGADSSSATSRLLPFHGKSSTLIKLADGISIAPGAELRFDAWLRITKPGLQTISLLAAYKALRDDGTKECFGPGNQCRTSFVSIQTRGLPSVGASMRLATKATSATDHTLIAEVANFLRLTAGSGESHPGDKAVRHSLGQIVFADHLSSEAAFADIEDNGAKVLGMLSLGAAVPFSYGQDSSTPRTTLLAAPYERVVGCFPVRYSDGDAVADEELLTRSGNCSWLMPLPEAVRSDATGSDSQGMLVEVMEQFLCIAAASEQFERDVAESRKLVRSEAIEADRAGPRTISQVRRDRQKAEDGLRYGDESTDCGDDSDSDLDEFHPLEEVSLCAAKKPIGKTVSFVKGGELRSNPSSLADIAFNEAQNRSVTIALLWVCRWEGRIRWGMQSVPNLSFVAGALSAASSSSSGSTAVPKPQQRNPADFLLVGLHYPHRVQLEGEAPYLQYVPVRVSLKSVSDRPLLVSVEAEDHDNAGEASGTSNSGGTIEKRINTGFRWSGKTGCAEFTLAPHTETDLNLFAAISQAGVYDLKNASIVAVVDDLSPLPLPTDRTAMSALDVSIQLLPGSRGVLDELLGRIYTSGEVPVLFPRVIIEAVREACDCFNLCITSTIDKLILCVGIHFQRRRSILTLCGRSDWLEELGLCGFKRLGSDVTAATSHALSRLLPFIGASDLEGAASGIVLTREGDRAKGGGEAKKYFDRLTFDKLVYDCLKLCRDELINEVSRGMLPADLLWSALISGAERYKIGASSKILGEMLRTVKVGLPIMDLTTVQRTVNKLCELVQMALELRASVVSEGDVAAVQYLERLGDIHDVKHALDAISALPSLGVAVRVDALQAQVAYLAPPSRPSSDDQENSADSVNVSTSEELLMMQRQQVKGRESSEGHEAESLSAADMFSFAKDDLLQWLSVAAEHHCRMPELSPVAAIFRLDDSELQTLVACSDTNLQMMFATALEDPSRFFQATKNAHNSFVRFDSTDLYDKFRDLRGQVVANEWIYGLSLFGEQWKQEAGAKPSTVAIRSDSSDGPPSKKSRVVVSASIEQNDGDCLDEENDDEEDAVHMQYSAEMRCRFAFALNDMDRAGLLRCKRAARHELVTVTREMHTWLGGGDSIDM